MIGTMRARASRGTGPAASVAWRPAPPGLTEGCQQFPSQHGACLLDSLQVIFNEADRRMLRVAGGRCLPEKTARRQTFLWLAGFGLGRTHPCPRSPAGVVRRRTSITRDRRRHDRLPVRCGEGGAPLAPWAVLQQGAQPQPRRGQAQAGRAIGQDGRDRVGDRSPAEVAMPIRPRVVPGAGMKRASRVGITGSGFSCSCREARTASRQIDPGGTASGGGA